MPKYGMNEPLIITSISSLLAKRSKIVSNKTFKNIGKKHSTTGKTILCLIILSLIITIAIFNLNYTAEKKPRGAQGMANETPTSIENNLWKENTLALLEKTHNWVIGTYDGTVSQSITSDLYTTYYATLIFQNTGNVIPNKQATINLIKTSQLNGGNFSCEHSNDIQEEKNNDAMSCIFYSSMTLRLLGEKPNDVASVIQHINKLQSYNGTYAFNQARLDNYNSSHADGKYDILATIQALAVLDAYGTQPQRKEQLIQWLVSQWRREIQPGNNQTQELSDLAALGQCLELLGVRSDTLPNQEQYLNWATALQTSIFNIQPHAQTQQFILFTVYDWINLIHFLDERNQPGKLLNSFSQKLKIFQQNNGGFDVSLGERPDIQGTFLATTFFREAQQDIPQKEQILSLIKRQMLKNGGFTSVNEASPTIATILPTFISLQIRDLLGDDTHAILNDKTLKNFVQSSIQALLQKSQNIEQFNSSDLRNLYYIFALAKRLNIDITPLMPAIIAEAQYLYNSINNGDRITMSQITGIYYLSLLIQFNNDDKKLIETTVMKFYQTEGGFVLDGSDKLETTWYVISILKILNRR